MSRFRARNSAVRVPSSHGGSRWFKSSRAHHMSREGGPRSPPGALPRPDRRHRAALDPEAVPADLEALSPSRPPAQDSPTDVPRNLGSSRARPLPGGAPRRSCRVRTRAAAARQPQQPRAAARRTPVPLGSGQGQPAGSAGSSTGCAARLAPRRTAGGRAGRPHVRTLSAALLAEPRGRPPVAHRAPGPTAPRRATAAPGVASAAVVSRFCTRRFRTAPGCRRARCCRSPAAR